MNKVLFSSLTDDYRTPESIYKKLDEEFKFNYDPCPYQSNDKSSLLKEWGSRSFVNPPYSNIFNFLQKGYIEYTKGKLIVFLIPSRTDTIYWHKFVMKATNIRFIKERLRFNNSKNTAPFPSCVVIFNPKVLSD